MENPWTTTFQDLLILHWRFILTSNYSGWPIGCFHDTFATGLKSDLIHDEIIKRNFDTLDNVFKKAQDIQRIIERTSLKDFRGSCNNCGNFDHRKRQCSLKKAKIACTFCSIIGHNENLWRKRRKRDRNKSLQHLKRGELL